MPAKKRAPMPDIMGEVLKSVSQQGAMPAQQQDGLPLRQHDSIPVSQHDSKPVKATFYLPPDLVTMLDAARLHLRGMASPQERAAVTLSAIVGAALRRVLQDLEDNGPESQLAAMLLSQHDGKPA